MQTQQQTSNTPVHVKVAYDDEFRRFLLTPVTFDSLQTTLKTLFSLESEFRIKFQDDENDWVLLTTDQELVYAAELSGSLLRLQVKLISPNVDVPPVFQGKGRGCRGRDRRAGKCGLKSREERLTMKSSRLSERINQLETKINSNSLPSERERVLRWRLTKLQEKLAFVQSLKESPVATPTPQTPETAPVSADVTPVEEQPKAFACKGGRCGRGGRGGWRRAMNEGGSDLPVRERRCLRARVAPEIIANFRQCKATLRAAREGGNTQEIQAALEAFHAAKTAKLDALAALRAQEPKGTDEQTA
jgi:hypothetical protein